MPSRKNGDPSNTDVIRIRIPTEIKNECLKAKEEGLFWNAAESTFFGYLLELGFKTYQKQILPTEKGDKLLDEKVSLKNISPVLTVNDGEYMQKALALPPNDRKATEEFWDTLAKNRLKDEDEKRKIKDA